MLLYNIKTKYDLGALQIVRISPRFAVMLGAMTLSIAFIILDVLSVTGGLGEGLPVGINPFWKLSFVFKCLTDSVVLDDFKTALDRLRAFKISRLGSFAMDTNDTRVKDHHESVVNANGWSDGPDDSRPLPIGNLPTLPQMLTESPPPETKERRSNRAEDKKYAGINRAASRDRDVEENDIQALDHTVRDRLTGDAQLAREHPSWPQRMSVSSADDADFDYAMAVREVSSDASGNSKGAHVSVVK